MRGEGGKKLGGQQFSKKFEDDLTEGKFQAKVEGEGVDRTVIWKDKRMWPYECDVCHEWVDEPDEKNLFECHVVVVGHREMGIACSVECCATLKDSEQVVAALEDGRAKEL